MSTYYFKIVVDSCLVSLQLIYWVSYYQTSDRPFYFDIFQIRIVFLKNKSRISIDKK